MALQSPPHCVKSDPTPIKFSHLGRRLRLQGPCPAANRPLLSANRPLLSLIRPLLWPILHLLFLIVPYSSLIGQWSSLTHPLFGNEGRWRNKSRLQFASVICSLTLEEDFALEPSRSPPDMSSFTQYTASWSWKISFLIVPYSSPIVLVPCCPLFVPSSSLNVPYSSLALK